MYAGRIPAMNKAAEEGKLKIEPTMTKEQMNSHIPAATRWKADNFNHLLEQPTNFYAVVLALQYLGVQDPTTVGLAWGGFNCLSSASFRCARADGCVLLGYVGVRIVHSLVQALVNKIMVRFGLFAVSSAVLAGLTAKAAQVMFL